ncbi:hypothetical protein [Winogradskya humida]|uniref:Uncharacterized protein n=1 Tax=Winogradskya humida TaxID=113566 RepID=A0ABQ4A652_9ACTN|nr:hypothetical protein [Actinoplanes humidus]GIE26325.1 hypothetical protein Ahu01nite_094270 [Actinoplanes humidus]
MEAEEQCTIDSVLSAASLRGHDVGPRLLTDWVARGLLDHPQKRPLGHARGSLPAIYTPQQRDLFLALLDKRRDGAKHIKTLAKIPIWFWLYYGDDWVPTRQVSRALKSWLGDYSVSTKAAARDATAMIKQFDHPDATLVARRRLHLVLTEVAKKRRIVDRAGLERAVRDVFEPANVFGAVRRGAGPSAMPVSADGVVPLIEARLSSAHAIRGACLDEVFLNRARDEFRLGRAEYVRMLPHLRAQAGEQHASMFYADTPESQLRDCANDFQTLLGFMLLAAKREARAASSAP